MSRIYVKDLACYKNANAGQRRAALKRLSPDNYFDLDLLPTEGLKEEWRKYLTFRGEQLSLGSIRAELWPYHVLCRFLKEVYPGLERFLDEELLQMQKQLKKWMMKNGYNLTQSRYRRELGKKIVERSQIPRSLDSIYDFLSIEEKIETEKDVWNLEELGVPVRTNPVHRLQSLNFRGIAQKGIRVEVKRAAAATLHYLAAATVQQQLRAVKRLAEFLQVRYPKVQSLLEMTRDQWEDYLVFLNTEVSGKKSFRSELSSLKSLIETVGKVYENSSLSQVILAGDIPAREGLTPRNGYTDRELQKLNEEITQLQEQIARVLILHQILANRISETLTLKQDCLVKRNGHMMVQIFEVKTQRTCYKPVNQDTIALLQKAIEYTRRKYGNTEYVFVNDRHPNEPMNYAYIQYHLMKMIQEKDLKTDQGQLFGVWTHKFRHSFAKRMTEMHVDDCTIAELLGHRGTQAVRYYRKFGNQALADETREVRSSIDDILSIIVKDW